MSTERGDFDREYSLKLDGQAHEIPWFMNRPAKVTATWDGAVQVLDTVQEVQAGQFEGTFTTNERWELSADSKTLTISSKMQGPMGEWQSTRVLEKQAQ